MSLFFQIFIALVKMFYIGVVDCITSMVFTNSMWHSANSSFTLISRAAKSHNKVKILLHFKTSMKHLQTKFHAGTMSQSKVIRSKFIIRSKCIVRSKFSCRNIFFFINILCKLQKQILICFCKFSCNSYIILALRRPVMGQFCLTHYWTIEYFVRRAC